jgi:agmatine deiminase
MVETFTPDTPAAAGYRMPAEWRPHEATFLTWPQNADDWPGKLSAIHWVFGEMIRRILPRESVHLLVGSDSAQAKAASVLRRVLGSLEGVEFHRLATDRGWMRDTGPIVVTRPGLSPRRAVVNFRFNAWAKYDNWQLDDAIAPAAAEWIDLPQWDATVAGRPVVLEGGAVDVNGRGSILTTEECLLDPDVQVRNPGWDRTDVEQVLADQLGATNVIWLGKGIAGDDTHGHVDDLCRFVTEDTVVLCREGDPSDTNHRPLAENRERLASARLEDGSKLRVVDLPMPEPLVFAGQRLPASYANFYIANAAVLVPTFNDPADRTALGILAELLPDRPVIGIHAVDLVWGLGTIHCLTQQLPGEA